MAAVEFTWDVFVPGQDLPRRITTDYVVSDGELLSVDGRNFLVEQVEMPDDPESGIVPVVRVTAPHEPTVS